MTSPRHSAPRPAAILDRDGTLIYERGFLSDPSGVEPLPGAVDAIRLLNEWGYLVIGVTNQSGVARGYYGAADVEAVNTRVIKVFAERGARIDRIYYCPHYRGPDQTPGRSDCECRKPRDGMVRQACQDFPIDLTRSFVAGDRAADVGLAQTLGVPGGLVRTGYGDTQEGKLPDDIVPAHIADDLFALVRWWGRHTGRSAD